MEIIQKKSSKRLDTSLHLAAYALNPFYFYNDPEVQDDLDANDAVVDLVSVFFPMDFDMQNRIVLVEFPMYKRQEGRFDRPMVRKACEVNDEKFDPALWWEAYGTSTPNLRKIAMRILSLTTSSSGCERNWSMFEGVHTKKRNRLEASRMNDLVFVQFNANLMERNKKRKLRNREVLVAEDGSGAKEWIVDGMDEEVEPGLPWEAVSEAAGVDKVLSNRTSARTSVLRELIDEEFESEDEEVEEVEEEVECESDGVEIIEQYGQDDDL